MKYLFAICVGILAPTIVMSTPAHAQGDAASTSARAAKSKLDAYRPGGHRCTFLKFDVYSSNQASVNRRAKLLDNEYACIQQYLRTEAIKLNNILALYGGGSVKVIGQSASETGGLSITFNPRCECKVELITARNRLFDAVNILMDKHRKRVTKFNNILDNGY